MTKFRTACLIHPHSPKMADPPLLSGLSRGSANKIHFRRADNTRVPRHGAMGGWDQLRARLWGITHAPGATMPGADAPRQPMPVACDEKRSRSDARRAIAGRTETP